MIRLSNLNKYYNKGRQNQVHAVAGIEMTLPERGMIALFGKSGCGKTTLLNMIGGLDEASSGEVSLDGKRISPDSDRARNINVGYIFQNYNLSQMMTVFENVASSLRLCGMTDEAEIEKRVIAALESVEMAKFRNRMPQALSGGQQQRVAIARAIVKNPTLILADEPTGNLDEQNTVMVMDLLKSISREHLVLLVTHEAHLVDSYCDKVIGMSDGRIIEERDNEITEGYSAKKSNEVYLGDMNRESLSDGELSLEYYGEHADKPTSLRIISSGGTLYVSAPEGVKIKIADSSSELIVHEGKYVEKPKAQIKALPDELRKPIPEGKTGRIYNFKDAVKSGYRANFAKTRKRKKMLIFGLACFSAIIVSVMATFGTAIYDYMQIEHEYNANLVAVNATQMTEEEARAIIAEGKAELYTVEGNYRISHQSTKESLGFSFGNFETSVYDYALGTSNENIYSLPQSMLKERKVIAGSGKIAAEDEIIIAKELADAIIETAEISSIKTYRDLIFSRANSAYRNNGYDKFYGVSVDVDYYYAPGYQSQTSYKVVGIVEGGEEEVFYHDYVYLQKTISDLYGVPMTYISDLKHSNLEMEELDRGEVYIVSELGKDLFAIGATKFTVADTFDLKISDEDISNMSLNMYGVDLTQGIDAFLQCMYGESSFEEYAKSCGVYDEKEYDSLFKSINYEYEETLADIERQLKSSYNTGTPSVIMHIEDMKQISTAYSNGKTHSGSGLAATFYQGGNYVFYSSDAKTLTAEFDQKYGEDGVISAQDIRDNMRSEYYTRFISLAITFVVVAIVLSLCLYFIMRSALLGDIKEVGISRAIGVSRKNLCYRYFIETMVLFALTIFVGYLLSSIFMIAITSAAGGVFMVVYYPVWLAIITLALIFVITTVCGQIPIRMLLRKTPAEILAKYDI